MEVYIDIRTQLNIIPQIQDKKKKRSFVGMET